MSAQPVRHLAVGLSAESVAGAWARQEGAPNGAVVTLDAEVAGRLRGGVPAPPGPAAAVIVRPSLLVGDEDRLWVAALVAAHRTIDPPGSTRVGWPDLIQMDARPVAFVNVTSQLGPGRIEMAIITLRTVETSLMPNARNFSDAVLNSTSCTESDFSDLAAAYAGCSGIYGRRVLIRFLPRGETRGTVTGFDSDGRLRIETPTGMVELLPTSSVRSVEVI